MNQPPKHTVLSAGERNTLYLSVKIIFSGYVLPTKDCQNQRSLRLYLWFFFFFWPFSKKKKIFFSIDVNISPQEPRSKTKQNKERRQKAEANSIASDFLKDGTVTVPNTVAHDLAKGQWFATEGGAGLPWKGAQDVCPVGSFQI